FILSVISESGNLWSRPEMVQPLAQRKEYLRGPVGVGRNRQDEGELIMCELFLGPNEGVQRGISSGFEGRIQQNDRVGDAGVWPVGTGFNARMSFFSIVYEGVVGGGKQHSRAKAMTDGDELIRGWIVALRHNGIDCADDLGCYAGLCDAVRNPLLPPESQVVEREPIERRHFRLGVPVDVDAEHLFFVGIEGVACQSPN